MDAGIIWVASLVAAILVIFLRKGRIRLGLLSCLYATFMYGFLTKAAQGGFEAGWLLPIVIVNAVVCFMAGLWLLGSKGKKRPLAAPALLLTAAIIAGVYAMPLVATPDWNILAWFQGEAGEQITVHFIDVGQGDSILICCPEGTVLIDAGTKGAGETVAEYLRGQGITRLDLVIATHPHEDHIGGLPQVLEQFVVGEVMDPGVAHTSRSYEDYLDIVADKDIAYTVARAGMRRDLGGGVVLKILHPTNPRANALNDASVVARLTYGSVAFLLAGDAEAQAEGEILASGCTLRSDVLKAGHHGSSTSSSPEFLQAVRPDHAVIMLGEDNPYGYPHRESQEIFAQRGIQVYRTDLHGNIVFTTDGNAISVRAAKHPDEAPGEGD